jgi:hypothetical protein
MTDITEQALAAANGTREFNGFEISTIIRQLVSELQATRAQRYNASELNESVIVHVLADIDQVNNEDSWSLRERLEVIQKICDGSEYT